jgi:hypothetical protein
MGYQVKPRHDPREVILKAHGFSNRICDDSHTSGSEREREREREAGRWCHSPHTESHILSGSLSPVDAGCQSTQPASSLLPM